jgi:sec-independent protein translocase protein TatB
MLDIGSSELLLIIIVAIVVIGPKDLPRALYKVGQVVGKARGMARHFRSGVDAMIREAELEELQKQWAKENERIMAESRIPDFTQMTPQADQSASPVPDQAAAGGETPAAFQTDPGPLPFHNDPGPAATPEPETVDAPATEPKGSPAA